MRRSGVVVGNWNVLENRFALASSEGHRNGVFDVRVNSPAPFAVSNPRVFHPCWELLTGTLVQRDVPFPNRLANPLLEHVGHREMGVLLDDRLDGATDWWTARI